MKNSLRSLLALSTIYCAALESTESTSGGSAETGEAAEARKRAAAANFLPIVRGRLPLVFVHAIRFNEVLTAMGNKDLATKFATSVGKVFDIKKGRNFGYVDASYKPSAEDIAAAEAWISAVGAQNAKGMTASGDKTVMQKTLDEYKSAGLATAEEVAALSTARTVNRKPSVKTEKPAAAPSVAGETVSASAGSADDLLS